MAKKAQSETKDIAHFQKTAFGRHETFALRYGWLTKGYQAAQKDPKIFQSDEATVTLGVGVNMVNSIRYWLSACQVIDPETQKPTVLGKFIFDAHSGRDPYLEDEATLWLLHWHLATNTELATAWYWFFNKFHKTEFTAQELATALADWVKANIRTKVSPATVKTDANLVLRMYTLSKGNTRTPIEEALDSPLSLLRLVSQTAGGRSFQCKPSSRPGLPIGILGYAVTALMDKRQVTSVPIEDLMYSSDDFPAIGSVFCLTESDLVTKLEKMIQYIPGKYAIRETAGIHQLYRLNTVEAFDYLEKHYANQKEEVAA
jgi:hypothetical protein